MNFLDVVIEVGGCIAGVVAEGAYEGLLTAMDCYMILESFSLICFVVTVSAMKLEDPSMSIFAVQHLVEPHVSITAFITSKH